MVCSGNGQTFNQCSVRYDYNYNNDDGVVDGDGDEDHIVSNEHFAAAILMKADNRALVSDCGSTMGL